ncbi:SCO family protein [Campylobacter insulaenigrae]|uniref:SCO family protein n=1 Tax=Campylobacter insulaenigrae TaxID=260714 RepID=UPI0021524F22|nr:SCO family protein [Campylobacter insulaenigrae]MCR6594113.1 SCO family protein [Campylobacter insulaenigrae]
MKKISFVLVCIVAIGFIFISMEYFKNNKYDFSLNSEKGMLSLKDFAGKKLVIYFGYTYCPDICPTELALIGKILKKLDIKNQTHLLFISLDPSRDNNLTQSNQWVQYFYPNSTALIAQDEKTLKQITQNYGVIYQKIPLKDSAMKYSIAHSGEFYLIDEKGKFFKTINDISYENFYNEIKQFLDN